MASPFEIEQAVHELLDQPYDPESFLVGIGQSFGATESWAKKVKDGSGAKSPIADGGVLWVKKFHGLTCAPGTLDQRFGELLNTGGKRKIAFRYAIATDGQAFKALDTVSGQTLNCDLDDLRREFWFLKALAGYDDYVLPKESEVDMQASAMLRRLYDTLIRANPSWTTPERQHDLNQFMTRVIFCLFAEDVGIFAENLFSRTVQTYSDDLAQGLDDILRAVFATMNIPESARDSTLPPWQAAFPYVNGGLFGGIQGADSVAVPTFNRAARRYLLDAGEQDWGAINPDIFGSMIQAIVDEDERAEGGLHYTSVPNIMKVLGPLFLDDLREELAQAQNSKTRLKALSQRLGRIRVFDPACGSGNFLVIAYRELREIEMLTFQRLAELTRTEWGTFTNIHLENFYGIEIRDFAAETARLSLYVAQFQMNRRFKENFGFAPKALPLTEAGQIHRGNALRMDWEAVCPPVAEGGETFICGNPPYKGSKYQSQEQKADLQRVFKNSYVSWRLLDYVAGWFWKASDYLKTPKVSASLVTTSSICQGTQVGALWPSLFDKNIAIEAAYTDFNWTNLASKNAGVTVVIIQLALAGRTSPQLFHCEPDGGVHARKVRNISPYLIEGESLIVEPRSKPISALTQMMRGVSLTDGGGLILTPAEKTAFCENHPFTNEFIYRLVGSNELINGDIRYCLSIEETQLPNAKTNPKVKARLESVSEFRLKSKKLQTRQLSKMTHMFGEPKPPVVHGELIVPVVSSENREFLPFDVMPAGAVISNKAFRLRCRFDHHGAIIASTLLRTWVATVCARMRTDLSFTNTLGWNTFPLPELTELQKDELTARAEEILLVRERHFPKSIAQLYDPEAMPQDLRDAHRRNDEVLEHIYIGRPFKNDTERLEHLFKLYAKMVGEEAAETGAKAVK